MYNRLLVCVSISAIAWGAGRETVGAAIPGVASVISEPYAVVESIDVKSLYKKNCARCHATDGSADTESGRLYETPDISGGKLRGTASSKLARIVTQGKQSMPAFRKKLTAGQISSLVEHMKSL